MDIRTNVSLAEHTTLQLGGVAASFVTVTTVEELREAVAYAHEQSLPIFILGDGSNILFSDAGWSGLVIHVAIIGRHYEEDSQGDARVTVCAGEVWDDLVTETVSQGLWGMENLSGIPGTVGATPVQNIGAYGVEVKDIIDWVEVLDIFTGDLHILSVSECQFGYRDSIFKHKEGKHYIVTRVAYRLSTHPNRKLEYRDLQMHFEGREDILVGEVRDAVMKIRAAKLPDMALVGTAGSFFKNPVISKHHLNEIRKWIDNVPSHEVDAEHVKVPLAWLLEKFGWKEKREGHVGCWNKQPLVLVHYGGGTASEMLLFAHSIMKDVHERASITLEPEVKIVGRQ